MRKVAVLAVLVALMISVAIVSADSGNGIPVNGKHYNLNIIGVKNKGDVGESMGHTLFVKLNGKTKITMTQAEDGVFQVTDRDGVNDNEAEFNIAPGYYNVYARPLGKPNKYVNITAYGNFTDAVEGQKLIWLGFVKLDRDKGKPQSVNINELFYVDIAVNVTEGSETYYTEYEDTWVFDINELIDYYWDYDNYGLKLLQTRFYECTLDPEDPNYTTDYCRWADGSPIEPNVKETLMG
jgi:uncharacterized lipoprotein NlpE involved in copper resistance